MLFLPALLLSAASAQAAGTAFTYQGLLEDTGTAAASYDFEALLYAANCTAAPCGDIPITVTVGSAPNVALEEGRFLLELDFGDVFTGPDRFLELRVRRTGAPSFTTLLPRQRVFATPYAQHAEDADFAAAVGAASITTTELAAGSVTAAKIDTSSVQARVSGTCAAGSAMNAVNANGSVGCETFPAPPTDFWSRSGNAGADPATNFLGTTDNVAFEIRTNSLRSLRLEPIATGSTINLIAGASANAPLAGVRGATIAGGGTAAADVDFSPGGAAPNRVFDSYGSIGGGLGNEAGLDDADLTFGAGATVGGGAANRATGLASVVAGGRNNVASANTSTIGGGNNNNVTGNSGTVAGGENNTAGQSDFVGGGAGNSASGGNATVGGGGSNIASQLTATIGGGSSNAASAQSSTIAGGSSNLASGSFASLGGGQSNSASGQNTTIGGGANNTASGASASVSGGSSNTARGNQSIVAGGSLNCAGGTVSFAAGNRAKVRPGTAALPLGLGCNGVANSGDVSGDEGNFMFADASAFDFVSTGPNRFDVRATGGVRFVTAIDAVGAATQGVKLDNGDSAWEVLSDRNAKAGIEAVDPHDLLIRVLALPIYRWHYRAQSPDIRHVGPMAQDFHAAFGLNGDDDKSISTLDPDGVTLAAIQGLNARLETETAALRAELAELRALVRELRAAGTEK